MKLSVSRLAVVASSLAVAALTALGCSKGSPTVPTDRGVNITVDAKALSSANLGMVTVGSLIVTGDELQARTFPVVPQISTGQLTFQYLPKANTATTAMLSFEFEALGDTGQVYGSGKAGPVTLAANAVSVTITLAPSTTTTKGLGTNCTTATDCGSGFCTDGVCCQEACKADVVCASCALTNTKGLCAPYAANTDPDKECAGFSMGAGTGGSGGKSGAGGAGGAKTDAGVPMDASASDAEPINPPDGGIMATASTCGGTCNGTKGPMACAFASPGTSCGKPFCNTRKDLANLVCDGKGSCDVGLQDCTSGYACDFQGKDCRTSCSANLDCLTGYYCNGNTNACAGTKADGLTCATDAECTSNHCASGVCCNTACDSPNSCNNQGSAGKCQCPGVTNCGTGVACQIFYQDADGDGYGNRNGVLGTTAKAACAGSPPSGFVADNTDCDDGDANVHPGQTGWFGTVSKGTGTFDYDCDGTPVKEFPEYPGAGCTFCPGCSACAPGSGTCSSSGAQASLACPLEGGICLSTIQPVQTLMSVVVPAAAIIGPPITIKTACCGCDDHAGFNATVACGQSGAYVTCGTCGASGVGVGVSGGAVNSSVTKQQLCH